MTKLDNNFWSSIGRGLVFAFKKTANTVALLSPLLWKPLFDRHVTKMSWFLSSLMTFSHQK